MRESVLSEIAIEEAIAMDLIKESSTELAELFIRESVGEVCKQADFLAGRHRSSFMAELCNARKDELGANVVKKEVLALQGIDLGEGHLRDRFYPAVMFKFLLSQHSTLSHEIKKAFTAYSPQPKSGFKTFREHLKKSLLNCNHWESYIPDLIDGALFAVNKGDAMQRLGELLELDSSERQRWETLFCVERKTEKVCEIEGEDKKLELIAVFVKPVFWGGNPHNDMVVKPAFKKALKAYTGDKAFSFLNFRAERNKFVINCRSSFPDVAKLDAFLEKLKAAWDDKNSDAKLIIEVTRSGAGSNSSAMPGF